MDPTLPVVDPIVLPLASSYLYLDDQGSARWQGEMSGFPLLDVLLGHEHETSTSRHNSESPRNKSPNVTTMTDDDDQAASPAPSDWFPDRQSIQDSVRPQDVWSLISVVISPELMDWSAL